MQDASRVTNICASSLVPALGSWAPKMGPTQSENEATNSTRASGEGAGAQQDVCPYGGVRAADVYMGTREHPFEVVFISPCAPWNRVPLVSEGGREEGREGGREASHVRMQSLRTGGVVLHGWNQARGGSKWKQARFQHLLPLACTHPLSRTCASVHYLTPALTAAPDHELALAHQRASPAPLRLAVFLSSSVAIPTRCRRSAF
jgi:hypothetical protein